jgi:hypothetical protein
MPDTLEIAHQHLTDAIEAYAKQHEQALQRGETPPAVFCIVQSVDKASLSGAAGGNAATIAAMTIALTNHDPNVDNTVRAITTAYTRRTMESLFGGFKPKPSTEQPDEK